MATGFLFGGIMSIAEQFKRKAKEEVSEKKLKPNEHFIGTGSTLLNLALSDRIDGGWVTGHMVHVIGDSNTGKSLEAMTVLAEAAHDPWFKEYLLEDNDREASREFDVVKLFGKKTWDRITQAPDMETVEDWLLHMHRLLDKEQPFVHILDSFDALTSKGELASVDAMKKGEKVGSMGMEKAKASSAAFRQITGRIASTKSLLMIVSQTRDSISPGTFAAAATNKFSGGNALKFYGHQRVFLAVVQTIKSRNIPIGSIVRAKVDRTRVTGKKRIVEFPVYYDYGIDDIGSMIDFLTIKTKGDDGIWHKSKNSIIAEDFGITCSREKLIQTVEEEGLEKKLKEITAEVWHDIEDSLKLGRKPKY